jgi:hypothetical protein
MISWEESERRYAAFQHGLSFCQVLLSVQGTHWRTKLTLSAARDAIGDRR